jgi:hypothetical protein
MEFRAVPRSVLLLSLVLLAGLSAVACDKASPVAPDGSILTLTANPSRVALNGTSTITILGRKADGNPLNPGTEVRLSSDRGTIDPVVTFRDGGIATATFRADNRSGAATITAMTGGGESMATAMIQVGESDETKPTVTVTVNPSSVRAGETATVTVIARNSDGTPVAAGQPVTLTTTLGTLNPSRPVTDSNGTATATLRAGTQSGTATITAIVGASDPATGTVDIRDVAANLLVSVNSTQVDDDGDEIEVTALVVNAQGDPVPSVAVTFQATAGSFENGNLVLSNTAGVAENTLVIEAGDIPANATTVSIIVSTPGANGAAITKTVTLTVVD